MLVTAVLVFAAALLMSAVLTPLAARLATRVGFVDQPGPRRVHAVPTPRLGGLAIFAAVGACMVLVVWQLDIRDPRLWRELFGILGGGSLLVLTGLLDDGGWLHPLTKLVLAAPASGLMLAWSGIRVKAFPLAHLLDAQGWPFLALSFLLTVCWVVVITSAFSILDYMDGLCAGVAAVAAFFLFTLATLEGQVLVGAMAAAILGANFGFLIWNSSPARVFMGDSGPLLLGFLMAVLGIKLRFPNLSPVQSWMIPIMLLGVPLFDTLLVLVSRSRRRVNPLTTPGTDHAGHRLSRLGLGQRGSVAVLYTAGAVCGLASLAMLRLTPWQSWALLGAGVLAAAAGVVLLERFAGVAGTRTGRPDTAPGRRKQQGQC
jgi:UDP-GlcNAc:undecaprenyl-phosphate GlcNAc-1-phosphate transferase